MLAWIAAWSTGALLVGVLPALPPTPWLLLAALLGGTPGIVQLVRAGSGGGVCAIASCLGAGLLGFACAGLEGRALVDARLPVACNRQPLQLEGRVDSLVATASFGEVSRQRFSFRAESLVPEDCGGPEKILLSYYGGQRILPGQRWRFEARLKHPWGLANPGSFNVQSWYAATGVHAIGAVSGDGELLSHPGGQGVHRLRQDVAAAIAESGLDARASGVLRAISVGDKSGIDHSLWSLCQQLGINHLLVISGLHVAMVAGLCLLLARVPAALLTALGAPLLARALPSLCALVGAGAYALLAGLGLPSVRALSMLGVFLLARACWRRSSGGGGLLVAAAAVLALQPFAALGSGFWLSFGAVAFLIWQDRWRTHGPGALRALRAHAVMAGMMLPAGALWFGGASAVALLANLLMVPLVGAVVVPLALSGVALWLCGLPGVALAWALASWPLAQVLAHAERLAAAWPLFLSLSGGVPAGVLALFALVILLLPLRCALRIPLLLLLVPLWFPARALPPQATLHLLDVGQGTAVVFTAGGRTLLYDTGADNPAGASLAQSVLLPWFRQHGIRQLDDFVVSHGDSDHSGGAGDILAALAAGQLWAGAGVAGLEAAQPCIAGQRWHWPGGVRFRFLSPASRAPVSDNDASCVLQITAPGLRILLPGDIGETQERALIRRWGAELDSDVLLVAHHGSLTSTAQSWLNHVDPQLALVGAGYASRFGHPHPRVVARLEQQSIAVHQTALEGAITVRRDAAGALRVEGWRAQGKRWWK